MPCTYDGPDDIARDNERARKELDRITDMLCRLSRNAEEIEDKSSPNIVVFDDDIREWWEEHKKIDAAREALEIKNAKSFIDNAKRQIEVIQKQIATASKTLTKKKAKK